MVAQVADLNTQQFELVQDSFSTMNSYTSYVRGMIYLRDLKTHKYYLHTDPNVREGSKNSET